MMMTGLKCATCGADVDVRAPFCRVCGAEPLLGDPWPETVKLPRDAEGTATFPQGDELRAVTGEELLTALTLHAWYVTMSEETAVRLCVEKVPRLNVIARRSHKRRTAAGLEQTRDVLDGAVAALRATFEELLRRAGEDPGIETPEDFVERFPLCDWVNDEFLCYLQVGSAAEMGDVAQRRLALRLALHGVEQEEKWAPEGAAYELRFNGLLLTPAPPTAEWVRDAADRLMGEGPVGGITEAVLLPAAWRRWNDDALAPASGVIVRVAQDELAAAGFEDPDWAGDRRGACRSFAARLAELYEREVTLEPAEVGGRPAVRGTVLLDVGHEEPVRCEHVFVHAGDHTYHVLGFAPLWAPEYADAVDGVVEGFAVAA